MIIQMLPEDDMSQLERDLLVRITERFNLWSKDGATLYKMGGLHSDVFARDRFILMLAAIAVEIAIRDMSIAWVARELINFVQQVRDGDND
jgi:hypothetical protein